jgi:hypothetical protein
VLQRIPASASLDTLNDHRDLDGRDLIAAGGLALVIPGAVP